MARCFEEEKAEDRRQETGGKKFQNSKLRNLPLPLPGGEI
jgi:hypothetical protein